MPSLSFGGPKQRHGAGDWNQPGSGNSLFRQMDSLFGQKNYLLSEEQGIGCKLLDPLGHLLQNDPERPESCENSKNSLLLSLFSGNGVELKRRPHEGYKIYFIF
jgi:hypothetical protein